MIGEMPVIPLSFVRTSRNQFTSQGTQFLRSKENKVCGHFFSPVGQMCHSNFFAVNATVRGLEALGHQLVDRIVRMRRIEIAAEDRRGGRSSLMFVDEMEKATNLDETELKIELVMRKGQMHVDQIDVLLAVYRLQVKKKSDAIAHVVQQEIHLFLHFPGLPAHERRQSVGHAVSSTQRMKGVGGRETRLVETTELAFAVEPELLKTNDVDVQGEKNVDQRCVSLAPTAGIVTFALLFATQAFVGRRKNVQGHERKSHLKGKTKNFSLVLALSGEKLSKAFAKIFQIDQRNVLLGVIALQLNNAVLIVHREQIARRSFALPTDHVDLQRTKENFQGQRETRTNLVVLLGKNRFHLIERNGRPTIFAMEVNGAHAILSTERDGFSFFSYSEKTDGDALDGANHSWMNEIGVGTGTLHSNVETFAVPIGIRHRIEIYTNNVEPSEERERETNRERWTSARIGRWAWQE